MFVCLKTETMDSENNSDNNGSRHNPYEWRAAASLYKIFMFYFFLNTPFFMHFLLFQSHRIIGQIDWFS